MTQKTFGRKPDGTPVKMAGWFSWRHKTREAHDDARETYLSRHGLAARRRNAAGRPATEHDRTKAHRLGRCQCTERAA